MHDQIIDTAMLQRRAKQRRPGELGAHEFQRWLGQWRGRDDVRVLLAPDHSHVLAVARRAPGWRTVDDA